MGDGNDGGANNGGGGNDGGANNGGGGNDGGQQQQEWKPPSSQAELDRIVGERLARERGKYADYDDLKTKAAKFDELENANKSELEKERDRANAAEAKSATVLTTANERLARAEVLSTAAELGLRGAAAFALLKDGGKIGKEITVDDDGNVAGVKEALEALAKDHDYLHAGGSSRPAGDGDGGARGGGNDKAPGMNDAIRALAAGR